MSTQQDPRRLWLPVVSAGDCEPCPECGELVCPLCKVHYADCECPGPTMDDEYEYRVRGGVLQARRWEP